MGNAVYHCWIFWHKDNLLYEVCALKECTVLPLVMVQPAAAQQDLLTEDTHITLMQSLDRPD